MRTKNVRPFRTDTSFASLEPRLPSPIAYITGFSIAPTVTLASAGDTDGTPSIVYWLRARKWPSSIRSTALLLLAVFVACPLALTLCAASSKEQVVAAPAKPLAFEKDILPIFQRNCLRCHSSTLKNGGLDLSTLDGVTAGSSSGPVVVA